MTTTEKNKAQWTNEIREFAENEKITFVKACQIFQSSAAQMGREDLIELFHEIKMESIN